MDLEDVASQDGARVDRRETSPHRAPQGPSRRSSPIAHRRSRMPRLMDAELSSTERSGHFVVALVSPAPDLSARQDDPRPFTRSGYLFGTH